MASPIKESIFPSDQLNSISHGYPQAVNQGSSGEIVGSIVKLAITILTSSKGDQTNKPHDKPPRDIPPQLPPDYGEIRPGCVLL